jgi:hypothetical protein
MDLHCARNSSGAPGMFELLQKEEFMEHVRTPAGLDARWRQWQHKNRVRDAEKTIGRARTFKILFVAMLVGLLLLRTEAADYHQLVRLLIAVGGSLTAMLAWRSGHPVWTLLFVAVAAVWNPILPTFAMAGSFAVPVMLATGAAVMASAMRTQPLVATAKASSR